MVGLQTFHTVIKIHNTQHYIRVYHCVQICGNVYLSSGDEFTGPVIRYGLN